jgi:hypothetical protein
MADSIDWADETLRPLDELARLAFPDGGVTVKTLDAGRVQRLRTAWRCKSDDGFGLVPSIEKRK